MIQILQKVGETNVVLELWVYDSGNIGVPGLTPKMAIRRTTDNKFLDFHDNVFKALGWVTRQVEMIPIDTVLSPGGYRYSWNSHLSVVGEGSYAVEYDSNSPGYGFDADYVTFTISDVSDVRKFLLNKRVIDKTGSVPIEKLYDDNGVTVIKEWKLEHSVEQDSRIPQ